MNWLRFDAKFKLQTAELRAEIAGVRGKMSGLKAELIKWMFLFWLGTAATMLGFGRFLLGG